MQTMLEDALPARLKAGGLPINSQVLDGFDFIFHLEMWKYCGQ